MAHLLDQKTTAALRLDPGKSDQIFFDRDLTGFGLRLRNDGARLRRTWIVQYRIKGRTRRLIVGGYETLTPTQARVKAKKELARVQLGQDPQADKEQQRLSAARTLLATAKDYLAIKEHEVSKGEYRASSYRVTKLYLTGDYFKPLHSIPLADIRRADIAPRLTAIKLNSGSVTAGRARAALSAMYVWALRQGMVESNPCVGTENPDEGKSRDRVLKLPELAAIWRSCDDSDFGKIVRLLILTGCRREEIGGLLWSDIDLDDGTFTVPAHRTKNGYAHTLPLTPMAEKIIRSIPQRVGRDHLFGDRSVTGFTDWNRQKGWLAERVKIKAWRLHDIRRGVATAMAEGGIEPHIIEALLNHISGHKAGVAGTYNRASYTRQIRTALMWWDEHLGESKIVPLRRA
jgi:integrase